MTDGKRSAVTEGNDDGGSWVDSFADTADIHSESNMNHTPGRYSLVEDFYKKDGFEGSDIDWAYWIHHGDGPMYQTTERAHTGEKSLYIDEDFTSDRNAIRHEWVTPQEGWISVWMYDTGTNDEDCLKISNSSGESYYIKTRTTTLGSIYWVRTSETMDIATTMTRTVGWHKFEFHVGPGGATPYIDGVAVGSTFSAMTTFDRAVIFVGWDTGSEGWFDDFEFKAAVNDGSLTSVAVSLPSGRHWDSVFIGCNITLGATMTLSVLNGVTWAPIPGLTDLDLDSTNEFDICTVESLSVALSVSLSTLSVPPVLDFWAISWNSTYVVRDTLFGGRRVDMLPPSFEVVDGNLSKTSGFGGEEVVKTTEFGVPDGMRPAKLTITKTDYPGARVLVTVLNGTSGEPVEGFTSMDGTYVNLIPVDPNAYPTLKIQFQFQATPPSIPVLMDWSVLFVPFSRPTIGPFPLVEVFEDTLLERALDMTLYAHSDLDAPAELTYSLWVPKDSPVDISVTDDHFITVDATITPNWNSEDGYPIDTYVTATDRNDSSSKPAEMTI
ncbi:MAG: hypothetical protein KAJ19_09170, partial [Gammaproteobacteria bacterium]|nr:hypothetical protein [Gammaproteobacteria bacterium]